MTDLLPCPFCGSNNLRHEFGGSQGYIECNECGALGPCDERAADPICSTEAAETAWNRRAALAQPEPQGPTDEDLYDLADVFNGDPVPAMRRALDLWGRPAIEPVPVSERFEFSVFDSEYEEQAGGTAPTYSQALSEGQHYLAMYSQDGPHSLEIRRVEVLPHHALPVPTAD